MLKKSITFILPGYGTTPIGGFKIVYEYATRLTQRGWKVYVIHPLFLKKDARLSFYKRIHVLIRFFKHKYSGQYLPKKWFKTGKKVRMLCVYDLSEKNIPNADFIVACPVESASYVNGYSLKKGKKYYFIQHFEDWDFSKEEVEKTWKYPLKKIVIAKWLQEIAKTLGETAFYVPNGLDFSFFKTINPFEQRELKSICFMSHLHACKGTRFAVDAMVLLKQKYPDLAVTVFSIFPKPADFPEFIEYYCNPLQEKLRELYNKSAVFLAPSLTEGFGLTPAEALMCSCVVIATDVGGHRELIENNKNGLFCQPASVAAIVEKVEYLFDHPGFAKEISDYAAESMKKFNWNHSVRLFENALLKEQAT